MAIGDVLANVGIARREIDAYDQHQEDRDYEKQRRAREAESYGIATSAARLQLDEGRKQHEDAQRTRAIREKIRTRTRQFGIDNQAARKADALALAAEDRAVGPHQTPGGIAPIPKLQAKGRGAMYGELADTALEEGDLELSEQLRAFKQQAEQGGFAEFIKAALSRATDEKLRDIHNANESNQVVRISRRKDAEGNLILSGYHDTGDPVELNVNQAAEILGLTKPTEYTSGADTIFNKRTGKPSYIKPTDSKPKDYLIELKRADGSTYLVDGRDPAKVAGAQAEAATAAGVSKDVSDRMWKALLAGKSEFQDMDPDSQKRIWDGYRKGLELLRAGITHSDGSPVDPGEVAIEGYRLAELGTVEVKKPNVLGFGGNEEEVQALIAAADTDLRRRYRFTGGGSQASTAKPPMDGARQAPNGKWYVAQGTGPDGKPKYFEATGAPAKAAAPVAAPAAAPAPVAPAAAAPGSTGVDVSGSIENETDRQSRMAAEERSKPRFGINQQTGGFGIAETDQRPSVVGARQSGPDATQEGAAFEAKDPTLKQLGDRVRMFRGGQGGGAATAASRAYTQYVERLEQIKAGVEPPSAPKETPFSRMGINAGPSDFRSAPKVGIAAGPTPPPMAQPAPAVEPPRPGIARTSYPAENQAKLRNEASAILDKLQSINEQAQRLDSQGQYQRADKLDGEYAKLVKSYNAIQKQLGGKLLEYGVTQ